MAEKDSMRDIMRKAEKKAEELKRELDLAKASQKAGLDSNENKNKQLDDLQTIITDQKQAIEKAHKESDELRSMYNLYRS